MEALIGELIRQGFFPQEPLLANEWRLELCSRRHSNFLLDWGQGGLFVKQSRPGVWSADATLAKEAALYRWVADEPELAPLRSSLPRLIDWDAGQHRLLTAPVSPAIRWWEAAWSERGPAVSRFRQLGRVLADCHHHFSLALSANSARLRAKPTNSASPFPEPLADSPPWLRQLFDPPIAMLARTLPGEKKLLELLRADAGLRPLVPALEQAWRPSTLIHNDLKLDNVLVAGKSRRRIVLVDWEMAQLGDPAWDVATVLAEALEFWVAHMPQDPKLAPARRESLAARPWPRLRVGIRAFLGAYRRQSPQTWAELWRRVPTFVPGALVAGAFARQGRIAEARLAVSTVLLLQLAANILRDPETAAVRLFGEAIAP